jgi:hypothetical protein
MNMSTYTQEQADRDVYEEYRAECLYFGITPKSFREWLTEDEDDDF